MGRAKQLGRLLGFTAVAVSLAGLVLLVAAGPGTRAGVWGFRMGLGFLRYAAYLGATGAAVGLLALVLGGARKAAALGTALGLVAFGVPWRLAALARAVPPIHDVTTDTLNPPTFVAILALRAKAPNSATYAGPEVATQQVNAYPDLVPLLLADPPDRAFARALDVVKSLGWEVVSAEAGDGRIEATDTTPWFGFKDDIVVRVRPDPRGSRVDVRSVSRVGRGDAGANAARIRRFRVKLEG